MEEQVVIPQNKEVRYLRITPDIEFRAFEETESSGPKLRGYALLFNQKSYLLPYWKDGENIVFREVILPGAADDAIANPPFDIFYTVDHNDRQLIANIYSKTLMLFSDERGLGFEADVDLGVSYAKDLYNNVKSGRVYSNSFAFTVKEERWEQIADKEWLRYIVKIDNLFDVSSVYRAAYPNTEIATRSFQEYQKNSTRAEDIYKEEIRKKNGWDSDYLSIIKLKIK
jgi:HK97 family phage prohead protease